MRVATADRVAVEHIVADVESIGSKGQIPQNAALKVLYIAAAVVIVGGAVNYLLKKKRK